MKKVDVRIGEVYAVKVSGMVAPVVIHKKHPSGGWVGQNEETSRQVRIKSAERLLDLWADYLARGDEATAPEAPQCARGEKKTKREPKAKRSKKNATGAKTGATGGNLSGLDAAAKVLEEAGEPLDCKTIVERAFAAGYWKSEGKTPAATVYAAIIREIAKKGEASRFRKVERGKFAFTEQPRLR